MFVVRGPTTTYRIGEAEVSALPRVDLDLYPSDLAVLLGPSGSGRSTLLNIQAPGSVARRVAKLPGVVQVQTRVVMDVTIVLAGVT